MELLLHPSWPPARLLSAPASADQTFITLLDAYRPTGGLLRGDVFLDCLAQGNSEGLIRLARKIADRQVLSFRWADSAWLPMFQFAAPSLEPRDEVGSVLHEWEGAWDGWDIAQWFVAPNRWLGGVAPLSELFVHVEHVRDAARADRFICRG